VSLAADSVGVVFGASSGIGRATAASLAAHVDRLYCCSRRGTAAADGEGVVPLVCDIRRHDEVEAAFDRAVSDRGKVDFVVNSVGVGYFAPLDGDYSAQWEETLSTNVVGLLNVLSAARRVAPPPGAIVHVGSVAAMRPSRTPGSTVYSVSKMAGRAVLDAFRADLRRSGVMTKVTHVAPGLVAGTEFGERYFDRSPGARRELYGEHANLAPEEVARAIVGVLAGDNGVDVCELVLRPVEQPT
jgi:NADP-dependent 3-hydroxy acid dehydrogenase YdfG